MRSDLIRYLILDQYGGVYAHFDVNLNFNLMKLINIVYGTGEDKYNFLTNRERTSSPLRRWMTSWHPICDRAIVSPDKREPEFYCSNYFMWAAPHSSTGQATINEIQRRAAYPSDKNNDYGVIFTTGPDAVTAVLNEKYDIKVVGPMMSHISKHITHQSDGGWRTRWLGKV